jgi:hypothetical protein
LPQASARSTALDAAAAIRSHRPADDGVWAIHFNSVLLAAFDERGYIITG